MADKQNPNDPEYDWLYAGSSGSSDSDAEPTRAISRPAEPHSPEEGGSAEPDEPTRPVGSEPEPTQVLDLPRGPLAPSPHPPLEDATSEAAPTPPPSFGGTYPAPPPPAANQPPRYATPATKSQGSGGSTSAPPIAPRPAGRPPSKKPSNKRKWWIRGILIFLGLWLLFLIVVPIWTWQHISKVDAEPSGDRPADTPGTTYLLVGSDSRADLSKEQRGELGTGNAAGQRTDTIIMLHVPDGGGPRLLLSIPRDSYVDIPGHGMNKINAAYAFGGADNGPKLLVQTVEQATGIRIDDYIEVGFVGFVDVVDAVGGITICPETAIDDPKAGNLKLKKGCQEVDGTTALGYSRSRHSALGDITRAQHQREVITAVGKKAASWQTVVLPWRYVNVNKAAANSLRIGENVGPIDLVRFGWAMSHTGGSDAKRCVVPYTSLGASTPVGSAVIWDDAAAKKLFDSIRDDNTAAIRCTATGQ